MSDNRGVFVAHGVSFFSLVASRNRSLASAATHERYPIQGEPIVTGLSWPGVAGVLCRPARASDVGRRQFPQKPSCCTRRRDARSRVSPRLGESRERREPAFVLWLLVANAEIRP